MLGILFIAIIVCTPFLFGEEGCDDGFNEVANSVDQNIQNGASGGSSNDFGLTSAEAESLLQLNPDHSITEADAKKVAEELAQRLDEEAKKSNPNSRTASRTIAGMQVAYYTTNENPNARNTGEESETIPLYGFNYADNEGFAIVSGDERLPDAIFYAEKGNIETIMEENPAFNIIGQRLPIYVANEIKRVNDRRNAILPTAIAKINATRPLMNRLRMEDFINKNSRTNSHCSPRSVRVDRAVGEHTTPMNTRWRAASGSPPVNCGITNDLPVCTDIG